MQLATIPIENNQFIGNFIQQSQQQMLSLTEQGKPVAFMMSPQLLELYINERIAKTNTQTKPKKKSRAGALAKYANPALIAQEETAWEQAVVEKYAHH
ncbi:MAG: hypothetical protein KGV51_01165 [Moraxellaceae bacterium]|nr:hypothetical protein [Moraxellaceae bacterium]